MEKEKVITLIDAFKDFKEEKNIDRPVMMQVLKDVDERNNFFLFHYCLSFIL